MQHPMPKERAEKGVGKHSKSNMGIKVDRPCKPEKKDKKILDEVINSVNSMQLSKTKQRTKKGLRKSSKAQSDMDVTIELERKKLKRKEYKAFLTTHAASELLRAVQGDNISFLDADKFDFEDAHIRLLERVVGSLASEVLIHSLPECFSAYLTKEEVEKLDGMDEIYKVFRPPALIVD